MTCSRCGGEMQESIVDFCVCEGVPVPILIRNVPSHVCERCGDKVFSDSTIEVFERIRDRKVGLSAVLSMVVYDFAKAAWASEIKSVDPVGTWHTVAMPASVLTMQEAGTLAVTH